MRNKNLLENILKSTRPCQNKCLDCIPKVLCPTFGVQFSVQNHAVHVGEKVITHFDIVAIIAKEMRDYSAKVGTNSSFSQQLRVIIGIVDAYPLLPSFSLFPYQSKR